MSTPSERVPDGQKWCPRCAAFRPTSVFGRNAAKQDGLANLCRTHQNEAHRASYLQNDLTASHVIKADRRRSELAPELLHLVRELLDVPCTDCGEKHGSAQTVIRYPVGAATTRHSPTTMARLGYAAATIAAWVRAGVPVCRRCFRANPGERGNRIRASDIASVPKSHHERGFPPAVSLIDGGTRARA